MMTTAALALMLVTASNVDVQGPSLCPTPSEVAALLPGMLPAAPASLPDVAWIEAAPPDLRIELRSTTGDVLFSRLLPGRGTCAELAAIAAVVIASWSAERDPSLSLMLPGVSPPPPPVPPPRPSLPAPAAPGADVAATQYRRRWEVDASLGLGSSMNQAGFVGAARMDAGVHGHRLGLRVGVTVETARSAVIETGSVSWRRYGLSLGPSLVVVRQPVIVDARVEVFAGRTTAAGQGFDVNRSSSAVAPGLALAMRLTAASGWMRPWLELGGQYWLADQELRITRAQSPNPTVSLPRAEASLLAGVSLVLSR